MAGVGTALSAVPRAAILRAADCRFLQRIVQRYGMRLGAARFVAGETLDECVRVLRRLNEAGMHANTTLLGITPTITGTEFTQEGLYVNQHGTWRDTILKGLAKSVESQGDQA